MDAAALLAWYRHAARPLPWRTQVRDPYRTWVSEVMLQQTRVDTVLRYHDRFLREFPDVAALAAAPEDRLMKAWEGMGYYRRARLLQQGARVVMARHGGRLPESYDALLDLPGFGPYTAGAVASLAFGIPAPAADGNVLRVASRILALEDDVTLPATRRKVERWVMAHQPRASPGPFNEALMELGATVCTPLAPRCGACPVASSCEARRLGVQEVLPVKKAKASSPTVRVALALARRGDALLLEKRESGLLAGTWGLPWVEVGEGDDARGLLARRVESLVGASVRVAPSPVKRGRHVFTHRRWEMEAYEVETTGEKGEWRAPGSVALGTAHRRMLEDG